METGRERDDQLWHKTKTRAGFKSHLIIYLVVNMGLWAVWFLTDSDKIKNTLWPAWLALGWGTALAYQYFNAWHKDRFNDALKEQQHI
ncbi:2TM domain-containing protein [Chitinophaga sp. 30R24]|uniref:2TM domain-containing protein n=1 Tax=Chitinophaga sp. 30R24 TaxID=3248838 RepID=UPI003B90B047